MIKGFLLRPGDTFQFYSAQKASGVALDSGLENAASCSRPIRRSLPRLQMCTSYVLLSSYTDWPKTTILGLDGVFHIILSD